MGDLRRRGAAPFRIEPDAAARAALARDLGIRGLRSLRLAGRVEPSGRDDWRLTAHLGATVVQDCVVTLDPVVTRIEEEVERHYVASFAEPEEAEAEMADETARTPAGRDRPDDGRGRGALAGAAALPPRARRGAGPGELRRAGRGAHERRGGAPPSRGSRACATG